MHLNPERSAVLHSQKWRSALKHGFVALTSPPPLLADKALVYDRTDKLAFLVAASHFIVAGGALLISCEADKWNRGSHTSGGLSQPLELQAGMLKPRPDAVSSLSSKLQRGSRRRWSVLPRGVLFLIFRVRPCCFATFLCPAGMESSDLFQTFSFPPRGRSSSPVHDRNLAAGGNERMCVFGGWRSRGRLFVVRGALMLFVRTQQVQALGLLRYSCCQRFPPRVVSGNGTFSR